MATSGSFSTDSVGSFYFTFEWSRTGYNSTRNEHYIHYVIKTHNAPGSYRTVYDRNLYINGGLIYSDTGGIPMYDDEVLAEGDFTIASSNSAGDGSFSASFDAGVGISSGSNCSGNGSWNLDRIPRYANFTEHYVSSTGLNSISVHWATDAAVDWLQYRLNGGNWADTAGSTYKISGLAPNTQYSIKTRVRRKDSGLWTESNTIYGTTKDIARITSAPNIEHGDSLTVQYSNNSNSKLEIGLFLVDGITSIRNYMTCTGNTYTFNFTDEELDNIYKLYGFNNQITLRVYLRTADNYVDYKDITVTLTGNQKTINLYPEEQLKRGKFFINKNRTPKRAVIWTCESTGWKRGI